MEEVRSGRCSETKGEIRKDHWPVGFMIMLMMCSVVVNARDRQRSAAMNVSRFQFCSTVGCVCKQC